jgi:hypothetical protein
MNDEPSINAMLEKQITTLEINLNRRLDATEESVKQRFDQQDNTLRRIENQVEKTNGRVTVLEKARERAQGVVSAYSWVPAMLTAVLTAGLTILVMALSGSIQ